MPTSRPRYQVTETLDVERALDLAAQRWPNESRSKLLIRLVRVGSESLQQEHDTAQEQRRTAVEATSGKYVDAFERGYLDRLREDWPA